jgi:hypothetical protein
MQTLMLSEILTTIEQIDIECELYMPEDVEWDLNTLCWVAKYDECEDSEEDPPYVQEHNLVYVFQIETVFSIVSNAKQQNCEVTLQSLYDAFIHYYDHDAFIDLQLQPTVVE